MILGNISIYNTNGYRQNGAFGDRMTNYKPSSYYSFFIADTTTTALNRKANFPTGTQPPYSWLLAPKGGEMSSTNKMNGAGVLTAGMANGINILADLDGSGTVSDASMALVTSMIAALTGSGTLTAAMVGTTQMAASLAGSGNLAGAMNVLAGLVANLAGSGALTADLKGKLYMEADIFVNSGTAEVNQIVAAVWSALAASYNESGTMGEKLNGAGSAGDPWTTDLAPYTTPGTAGKKMKDTLSQNNFIALK